MLHLRADTDVPCRLQSERLFCVSAQQLVEIRVAPGDWKRRHRARQNDLVSVRAELDFNSKERFEIGRRLRTVMPDPEMLRREPAIRDVAEDAHQCHEPEFD